MKHWDFAIGNPAYQESAEDTSDKPVYNYFMDEAYKVADKVEMITPARFLFNTGKTPKNWNEKMLQDEHFKVCMYEQDSGKVFAGRRIPGGIAITYRDKNKTFGAIDVFSQYPTLQRITEKMQSFLKGKASIMDIMFLQNRLDLDALYEDYPDAKDVISSDGRERRIVSSAFNKLPIFTDTPNSESDLQIFGLEGTGQNRKIKYANKKYICDNGNLHTWKVMFSKSNGGAGNICDSPVRIIKEPFILEPEVGYTQSFIGIGSLRTNQEAVYVSKYLKTQFARCMLGILKATQDNPPDRWKYVPLQDFTSASDIDWSRSIAEIDQQLYKKYGLTDEEIQFIETHVKEMN